MCIVGYFSRCGCGHFSHPSHAPLRDKYGRLASLFTCRDCDPEIYHRAWTMTVDEIKTDLAMRRANHIKRAGWAIAVPDTMPDHVTRYIADPEWVARFLPSLAALL